MSMINVDTMSLVAAVFFGISMILALTSKETDTPLWKAIKTGIIYITSVLVMTVLLGFLFGLLGR